MKAHDSAYGARSGGEMNSDLIDVELMTDPASLASLSAEIAAEGGMLVCHRCDDIRRLIAGVLIMRESEEAWVLCGPCLGNIPLQGQLVS
jgi:hypothetical protein